MTNNEENWRMERAGASCNWFYRSISAPNKVTKTKPSDVWLFWLFLIPNDMATVCPGGVTTTVTPQWPMWLAQDHCSDSSLSPLFPSPSRPSPPCLDPILARFCLRACSCHVTTLSSWFKLENFDGTTDWRIHGCKNIHLFSLLLPSFFNVNLSFCYFSFTSLSIKKLFLREACASEISSGRDALIRSHLSRESHGKATSGFPRTGLLPQQRTRSQFWSCNCNSEQSQSRSWCKGC